MNSKEFEEISRLVHPTGESITGKDQQKVFNLMTVMNLSVEGAWEVVQKNNKELESNRSNSCSIDDDDCLTCGS